MTPRPTLRDGQRPPTPDTSPAPPELRDDAVPRGCLCRMDDLTAPCPADLSTCEDLPVMFFS